MPLRFCLVWPHFGFSAADFGYIYDRNVLYGSTYSALFVPPVSYFYISRPNVMHTPDVRNDTITVSLPDAS